MTPRARRQAQIAITLCVSVYGFTIGLVAPLIAVFLEQRGFNAGFIGLNAAMTAFGMIAVTPILPRLAASLGIKRVILGCLLVDALCLLSFPFVEAVWLWFGLRFFIGAANNVVFIAAETWINEIAEDAHRGRMLAIFNAVLVLALSLGPLVMPLTGGAGASAFVVGAAVIACAALPLAFTGRTEPTLHGSASFNILSFIWMAPVVSCAVLLYSWRETGIASFLPVYSLHNGLPLHAAAINLTTMGLGGVTLAYVFGWMADRFERFRLLGLCGAGIGLCAVLLPLVIHHALWRALVLFCWGGLFTGLYTVTLALVGERYKGMELAVANIAIGLLWGLGALSGSSLTGAALSWWDPHGFPLLYTLAGFAFAGFVGWRSLTGRAR